MRHVYISRRVLRCVLLCEGTATSCFVVLFASSFFFAPYFFYFFFFFWWMIIRRVFFSRVSVVYDCANTHNEVGTNGTPCTHTHLYTHVNVFLASNVLLLFSSFTAYRCYCCYCIRCCFFSFESIKYEICFYSFRGFWTIVTTNSDCVSWSWFLRASAFQQIKINTANYFQLVSTSLSETQHVATILLQRVVISDCASYPFSLNSNCNSLSIIFERWGILL